MKTKFNKLYLMAMVIAIFTGMNQNCFAEDTIYNSRGGFTKNMGQLLDTAGEEATDVLFYSSERNVSYYLLDTKIAYSFSKALDSTNNDTLHRMDLIFNGAGSVPEIRENNQLYYNNYYLTHTGEDGIDSVGVFESVDYLDLLENIEIKCSMVNGLQLEYKVNTNGSPHDIEFYFDDADSVKVSGDYKTLSVYFPLGVLVFDSIYAYQVINNHEVPVDIAYRLENDHIFFDVGTYDDDYSLSIIIGHQPAAVPKTKQYWTSAIGGSGSDGLFGVSIDVSNNVYAAGITSSASMPFPLNTGQFTYFGLSDAFVVKFNSGRGVAWASYFGGSQGNDKAYEVTTNSAGYVYVAGQTRSNNLWVCTTCTADTLLKDNTLAGTEDIFIVKFNSIGKTGPTISGTFATYFGGADFEEIQGMTVDNSNNVYLSGRVTSGSYTTFPKVTLSGAYNQNFSTTNDGPDDGFITKISSLDTVLWSTAVGGNYNGGNLKGEAITGMTTDNNGNLYATGFSGSSGQICTAPCTTPAATYFPLADPAGSSDTVRNNSGNCDAVVMKFNASGAILWSTMYGGQNNENTNNFYVRNGIAVDANENIFITGYSFSTSYSPNYPDFPKIVLSGAYNQSANNGSDDAFIAKFNSSYALVWSTFYGGSGDDVGFDVACGKQTGLLYFTGVTSSSTFPTVNGDPDSYSQSGLIGGTDAFLLKFTVAGTRLYAMWYGGSDYEEGESIATDLDGTHVIFCGRTNASNFPFHNLAGAYNDNIATGNDGYIANLMHVCSPCSRIAYEEEGEESKKPGGQMLIFPNPAFDYITLSNVNLNGTEKINIINSLGDIVKSFNSTLNTIYVGDLSPGLYVLQLNNGSGNSIFSRFIVPGK